MTFGSHSGSAYVFASGGHMHDERRLEQATGQGARLPSDWSEADGNSATFSCAAAAAQAANPHYSSSSPPPP
jgi:hypothetical protein